MSTPSVTRLRTARGRVTQGRVLRSEWIKPRTLRSTFFTMTFAVGAVIGFGPLVSAFTDGEGDGFTGMIRTTLAAVPSRLPVLWAKAVAYAAVVWTLMTTACLTAFLVSQSILSSRGVTSTSLEAPGVARVVFGTALYLTVLAVLGVAIGMLTRNTAAGITTVLAVLFILPVLTQLLPAPVAEHLFPYLPSSAGRTLTVLHPDASMVGPWSGFILFCLYAACVLAGAAVVLKRRDG
ncbi:ABC transporter permease [Streptomyces sp. NPDC005811]|uniref:ABC transporter permease n=1 Tax=Streptomyces sp. NPDC005811 TaxID=3154565 RepID=UPI0033EEECD6